MIVDVLLPEAGPHDVLGHIIGSLANSRGRLQRDAPALKWSPTAVVFERGDRLISRKPFTVHRAQTRGDLEYIVNEVRTP